MNDIDANGSWGNAVSTFEQQRPDLQAAPQGTLTGTGPCVSCGTEGNLYRTEASAKPDTCTGCRGPVR